MVYYDHFRKHRRHGLTVVTAECSIEKPRVMMGTEHDMYHKFYSSAHWTAEIDLLDME